MTRSQKPQRMAKPGKFAQHGKPPKFGNSAIPSQKSPKSPKSHGKSDPTRRRRAIIDLLQGVFIDHRPISDQMLDAKSSFARLAPHDRAQAQRHAMLVLRHLDALDDVLTQFMDKSPPMLVRQVLRLCIAEMWLDAAPPYAAIDGAVSLAKTHPRLRGFSGFINAVGRNFTRSVADKTSDRADGEKDSPEVTGADTGGQMKPMVVAPDLPPQALPKALRTRLTNVYGKPAVTAFEIAHAQGAAVDLTLKDPARADEYIEKFTQKPDGKLTATRLPNGSIRLKGRTQISTLDGYQMGDWWVQDAAAALPVRTCGDLNGKRVLDLCAAPGGKTLQIAAQNADLTALDISKNRSIRLQQNLDRTGLTARVVIADALDWQPDDKFDVILLDAPCSATGTMRRHPDLPFVKPSAAEPELVALQRDLIARATGWLAQGGVFVFATCSLFPEEGELQADWIKQTQPNLQPAPLLAEDYGFPNTANDARGGLRLRPDFWADLGGMDGFYIVKYTNG